MKKKVNLIIQKKIPSINIIKQWVKWLNNPKVAKFSSRSLKKHTINSQKKFNVYFERAWWASFFVLLCSQMFDVQYYDGRISIAFWILLAGLRQTINENY